MARRVGVQRREGVALITLGGSAEDPSAGFDLPLRRAFDAALSEALATPDLKALVLRAGPNGWPQAADPFADYAPEAPSLADLATRIAAAPVPVVIVLSGMITGGTLALSLAAGLRLAHANARFFCPEPGLGLIPAAGALVRLVRRAGGAAALDAVLAPAPLDAQSAMHLGLCDAVASEGTIETAALSEALRVAEGGAPFTPPDAALADAGAALDALLQARARHAQGPHASLLPQLTELAEAALLLPLEAALDVEAVLMADLLSREDSAALRHLSRARRIALQLGGLPTEIAVAEPRRIALWNPPERLVRALLSRGVTVQIGASQPERLEATLTAVAHAQHKALTAGRIDAARRDADWARLEPVASPTDFTQSDLLIANPTTPEDLADLRARPASAGIMALTGATPAPGELGVDRTRGLAAIWAPEPGHDGSLAQLAMVLRTDGTQVIHGVALPLRLEVAFIAAAERAILAGASPAQVDRALTEWGFPEGPCARLDALGLNAVQARFTVAGRRGRALIAALVDTGRLGKASGAGIYDYPDDAPPQPRVGEENWLAALRLAEGITPQGLTDAEIVARVLAELAGEGAAALETGRAHRASDIDLAAEAALGFPRRHGGPMFQADRIGALALRKRLRALVAEGCPLPSPRLDRMIRDGEKFFEDES
ncbi:3-hydroxyacyl-CoA dehydrogenase [Rhodobacter sp. JA431]|uniref:enoyl-CoA hydratase-related protein n=1 Tax=Rhodobacter sp. JA431 TaxID=570013 RepID=UPI000BC921FF|nr:enoyl-CoA hydratase-related protein [Rhodobacter sp. JA431]SOC12131.1 3-hydroxyacyl-CoA dehydrogenase [Rhodobacter sp. JA431]